MFFSLEEKRGTDIVSENRKCDCWFEMHIFRYYLLFSFLSITCRMFCIILLVFGVLTREPRRSSIGLPPTSMEFHSQATSSLILKYFDAEPVIFDYLRSSVSRPKLKCTVLCRAKNPVCAWWQRVCMRSLITISLRLICPANTDLF